ncbi:hypothetical protein N752_18550 [Desulforamulus aquiferis]|nr:cell division FtsA domain-containing protein [Desulforamulus aquiferis]RYD03749.1 hypothetical protein N752_18550 [Desulforamulus aquiferis]
MVIPEQLRLLNLALVDIGAGTSDIAITSDGSVKAYGMVPTAGDEITEILMENLMVDFMTAEQIKRSINSQDKIDYQDVLGMSMTINKEQLLNLLSPSINKLAEEIAANIVTLNGGAAPKSVMCVGGGSQVPDLTNKLANKLGLAPQRVVIRERSNITNLTDVKKNVLSGPEGVTVVGIAAVAAKKLGRNFITVTVNEKSFTLFNTRQLNVINALAFIELSPRELLGQNGKDIRFTINGKSRIVYGEMSKPAEITVNDKTANLQTPISDGDIIKVVESVNGKNAVAKVADFFSEIFGDLTKLNVNEVECTLNGNRVNGEQLIKSGDVLELKLNEVQKQKKDIGTSEKTIEKAPGKDNKIQVTVNGQRIEMSGGKEYILIDIFNYFNIDLANFTGTFELKHNGEKAEYTDVLRDGDNIEIKW